MLWRLVPLSTLVWLLILSGCNNVISQPEEITIHTNNNRVTTEYPLTIEDAYGEGFIFESAPERIIAIDSGTVEILFKIGYGSKIVGVHEFVRYPAGALDIARVGNAFALDFESIIALNPDLVVIFFDKPYTELSSLGLPVLYLDEIERLDEIPIRIRMWGAITDRVHQAIEVSDEFQRSISRSLTWRGPGTTQSSVYYDLAPGWWTSGRGTLPHDVITTLGLQNIFEDLPGWPQISLEQLIARNPDIIITLHPNGRSILLESPVLGGLKAVETDSILEIDPDLLSIDGPRLANGVNQIADWLVTLRDSEEEAGEDPRHDSFK